jgi:hypothetical protein
MRPHELRDDQWDLIRNELPGRAGSVGVTAANNRRFVDAVMGPSRDWGDHAAIANTGSGLANASNR